MAPRPIPRRPSIARMRITPLGRDRHAPATDPPSPIDCELIAAPAPAKKGPTPATDPPSPIDCEMASEGRFRCDLAPATDPPSPLDCEAGAPSPRPAPPRPPPR